jgi:hypothetical protein
LSSAEVAAGAGEAPKGSTQPLQQIALGGLMIALLVIR